MIANQEKVQNMRVGRSTREASDGNRFDSINPFDGSVVATLPEATSADVDLAVKAASTALDGEWSQTGPADRQALISRLANLVRDNRLELARLDTVEMGMPISRSLAAVDASAATLDWYAAMARTIQGRTIENSRPADRFSYTIREPVGVVGAITPWNVPMTMLTWKLGPVLATGSTLVLKPSELSSLSALRVGELCIEAGIPPGVVNVITGGRNAGVALVEHRGVNKLAFTGSVETGQAIIRASAGNIKRLTMELGGKSPVIVFPDANLDEAAKSIATSIFGNSGQVCVAGSRLFVHRTIQDELLDRVKSLADELCIGDPLDHATQLGPLASKSQMDRVLDYISSGKEQGARLFTGGQRLKDKECEKGYFVEPAIFSEVTNEMKIAQEEIFGPVLTVTPFNDADEALYGANSTDYGLSGYVWTEDLRLAHKMISHLRAGNVSINSAGNLDPAVPTGGRGMSGYGKELGAEQLDEYLETKSVWIAR